MSRLYTDPRPNSGCDYHRTQLPLQHIGPIKPKTDTLFINRDTHWSIARLRAFKADGGRLVYDQDDSFLLPVGHPLYEAYQKQGTVERLMTMLDLADVVTVTTPTLAKLYGEYTKAPIEVLPNALPYDRGQFAPKPDAPMNDHPIIWAGGSTHEVDLALVAPVIDGRLLALAGYSRVPPWFNMVQMFPGCRVKPLAKVGQYMQHYDGHRMAIAPLATSEFAACKSNLKILEAGAKNLPIVCSYTEPYSTPDMMHVVRFASWHAEWQSHIGELLDGGRAVDEGLRLGEHVRKHYHLDTVNEHRRQILEG